MHDTTRRIPSLRDGGGGEYVFTEVVRLGIIGMEVITIPRHGSRPRPTPRNWLASSRLPGAINIGFFDGHVEQVQLERLWQLFWHNDYAPPAKRPGLP